jgi:hypothetical protein
LLLPSCIDLIYAHIVGEAFSTSNFQDYIIDTMAKILNPAQTPDLKILEILFLEKHASSNLKKFIIDRMFAHERRMLGMLRNDVEGIVTSRSDVKGCEYHVHEEGMCYKQSNVTPAYEEVREEKKWSVEDDADLNAIATHYLGRASKTVPMTENEVKSQQAPSKTQAAEYRMSINAGYRRARSIDAGLRSCSDNMYASRAHHHGSAAWSCELDGPKSPTFPREELDKPLPPTPPPSSSPPVPFSFNSSPASAYESAQIISAKDLVFECLARLSPTLARASTHDPKTKFRAAATIEEEDPSLDRSPAISTSSSDSCDEEVDIPLSLKPASPQPIHLSRDFSFLSIPKPHNLPLLPSRPQHTKITPSQSSHYLPTESSACLRPLITRKPAPLRGLDWIEQWDRLYALRGTQGFGLRKEDNREKKSRFLEILESVKGSRADM